LWCLILAGRRMIVGKYNRQKEKTEDSVWTEAKEKAEVENRHPTAEDFVDTVMNEIQSSCIEIAEEYVPVEIDRRRDEIYFSRDKYPQIGQTEDCIWFKTQTEEYAVRNRLSTILGRFDVNLGLVSSEEIDGDNVRYEIKIPFISEEEREQNIREDTVELAREMRGYKDVDEDSIVGDCPRDDCDGKQYRNGMGSCGPKYECTRFGCGFRFVKDVL
jgi:hypothetical protein